MNVKDWVVGGQIKRRDIDGGVDEGSSGLMPVTWRWDEKLKRENADRVQCVLGRDFCVDSRMLQQCLMKII